MARRIRATLEVTVERSPEDVFAYLADVERHNEWSPKPYRVEGNVEPLRLGSRFTSFGWVPRDPDHRNEVEVTAFEPSSRIEFTATEQGEQFINTFTLTPQPGGTRLEKLIDMPRPPGVAGLLFPLLFAGLVKPATQKGLGLLKQRLEG
jgi:uncharacterized protein YndB with AHSA1/START domain